MGSVPGLGRPPGEGHGDPLQCSCWRIPRTEKLSRLQSVRSQLDMTELLTHTHTQYPSAMYFLPHQPTQKEAVSGVWCIY